MADTSLPPPEPRPGDAGAKCGYCLSPINAGDDVETCPDCGAVYHRECWAENGGCSAYGCTKAPAVEARRSIEVPFSYWGQEHKPCPSCGQQILAAAVRCRHCGATFASAQPQDAVAFLNRTALEAELPSARTRVVVIFILSVLPFTAPVGAIWGYGWSRTKRELVPLLPPLHAALLKIALVASVVLTVGLVVMTLLYRVIRVGA